MIKILQDHHLLAQLSHRETDENYAGELFRDNGYRVATCKDHIQWLLQRQTHAGSPAGPRWKSVGFFTTKAALSRVWLKETGKTSSDIAKLPAH